MNHLAWQDALENPLPEDSSPLVLSAPGARTTLPGLLPKQIAGHESRFFRAKLAIPPSDEPLDDSWEDRHAEDARKKAKLRKMDQAATRFLDSSAFRGLRKVMLVSLGGMCAGLILFLQDRKWVLAPPWKPAPVETVVEIPLEAASYFQGGQDPSYPFVPEDPSELESPLPRPLSGLAGDPLSIPVKATPIASGKK